MFLNSERDHADSLCHLKNTRIHAVRLQRYRGTAQYAGEPGRDVVELAMTLVLFYPLGRLRWPDALEERRDAGVPPSTGGRPLKKKNGPLARPLGCSNGG